jgi:hypothetical protein
MILIVYGAVAGLVVGWMAVKRRKELAVVGAALVFLFGSITIFSDIGDALRTCITSTGGWSDSCKKGGINLFLAVMVFGMAAVSAAFVTDRLTNSDR